MSSNSFPCYTGPNGQIADSKQREILDLIALYFGNVEIKNLFAMLHKSPYNQPDSAAGWVSVHFLGSLKRVKAVTKVPLEIAHVVSIFGTSHFEVSVDGIKIRRTIPFEPQVPSFTITVFRAGGFPTGTSRMDVHSYFSEFTTIANVQETISEDPEKLSFLVQLQNPNNLVPLLAQKHSYEGFDLQLRPESNAGETNSVRTQKINDLYGLNRVILFGPVESLVPRQTIASVFEQYGTLAGIEFDRDAVMGYAKYKKPIAKEVCKQLKFEGGLIINGEPVEFRALEGEEERLFWEVQREKKKLEPPILPISNPKLITKEKKQAKGNGKGKHNKGCPSSLNNKGSKISKKDRKNMRDKKGKVDPICNIE